MNTQSAQALAFWLLKTHPDLFNAIAVKKGLKPIQPSTLGALGQDFISPVDMSSLATDVGTSAVDTTISSPGFFSSLGSDISGAVSDVGSWLSTPSNVNSLTNLAATYFKTQASAANANAQTAVLQTQVARANAGLAPAPITYNSAGQPVYVPGASQVVPAGTVPTGYTATGAPIYNVTPNTLASLGPNFLQQYGIWLLLGGAALVAAMIFMRK